MTKYLCKKEFVMETIDRKKHWENIYTTKKLTDVSWYEPQPVNSLEMITAAAPQKHSSIVDIGGGDSFLADNLLEKGYTNITVVDISEAAINRAKERLGKKADHVKWVVSDIVDFKPTVKYDVWHDRAAFHFLTKNDEIHRYVETVNNSIRDEGTVIIGTFSEQGPTKCSGIEIKQYSETSLTNTFQKYFVRSGCRFVNHKTPFDTVQNFIFCVFKHR